MVVTKTLDAIAGSIFIFFKVTGTKIPNSPATTIVNIIEMEIIKELASDDKGYRSLTDSWFKNAPLLDIIQAAQKLGFSLIAGLNMT